ncbi:MAG: AAA family ATPase [Proteobacteria bacterium]|nr:AAA family ATPase [Pseudomonadota bacterium]
MSFRQLKINGWQQFQEIELNFHERLTILTGANGSGKTTILNLLARHHDWPAQSLATPTRRRGKQRFEFLIRLFRMSSESDRDESQETEIGTLVYESGQKATLVVRRTNAPQYQININGQQSVACFFIPSHRPVYRYEAVNQIPTGRQTKDTAFQRVWESTKTRYFGGQVRSASFHMKEMLISWSIFGRGNEDMPADEELLSLYLGFQVVLRKILPPSLGFRQFAIRDMEVVLECESGDFLIDAASGDLVL